MSMPFGLISISLHFALVGALLDSKPTPNKYKFDPKSRTFNPVAHYNVLTDFQLLICSCDKCGTTSLYNYVYEAVFHTPWPYSDYPRVAQLYSDRWNGKFKEILKRDKRHRFYKTINELKYKFALIRDPKERLISAWKSKVACDEIVGYGHADDYDRRVILPHLFKLAGQKPKYCVSLDEFVELLHKIHLEGNDWRLDSHFRPQQHVCFGDVNASEWTMVAPISDPRFRTEIAKVLHAPSNLTFPHLHASTNLTINISQETEAKLAEVTRSEYEALGLLPK